MRSYTLSNAAQADIEGIARYSQQRWGTERAEAYLWSLHRALEVIAPYPKAGRDVSDMRPAYFRF